MKYVLQLASSQGGDSQQLLHNSGLANFEIGAHFQDSEIAKCNPKILIIPKLHETTAVRVHLRCLGCLSSLKCLARP